MFIRHHKKPEQDNNSIRAPLSDLPRMELNKGSRDQLVMNEFNGGMSSNHERITLSSKKLVEKSRIEDEKDGKIVAENTNVDVGVDVLKVKDRSVEDNSNMVEIFMEMTD